MPLRLRSALVLLLISSQITHAQEFRLSERHFDRVGAMLKQFVEEKTVAGAQALLWDRGGVVYFESAGYQDLEDSVAVTDSTLFRIYSMTKPVTSVAALMLLEEGKLRLEDPVSRFIPEFGNLPVYDREVPGERIASAHEATIHDLLTHRAGLTYGLFSNTPVDSMYWAHQVWEPGTLEEFAERVAQVPLLHEPGKVWHYSVATDILGRVVEISSGQALDEFFQERIFGPLGMHDTGFSVSEDRVHRLSTLYREHPDGSLQATDRGLESEFVDPVVFLSGGGGLVSTAYDYIRFAEMLIRGGALGDVRLLSQETVTLMTQDHLHRGPGFGWGFGLGVEVFLDADLAKEPGHDGTFGWSGAANTFFFVDPKAELIGMVFTQLMPYNKNKILRPFKQALYDPLD